MKTLEFMECDTCQATAGTPTLCQGCLNNRSVIESLTQEQVELQRIFRKIVDQRDEAREVKMNIWREIDNAINDPRNINEKGIGLGIARGIVRKYLI